MCFDLDRSTGEQSGRRKGEMEMREEDERMDKEEDKRRGEKQSKEGREEDPKYGGGFGVELWWGVDKKESRGPFAGRLYTASFQVPRSAKFLALIQCPF